MTNHTIIAAWLCMGGLVPFEIDGRVAFPTFSAWGGINAEIMIVLARDADAFPADGDFGGKENGISKNGRFYRVVLGVRPYSFQEITHIRLRAEDALS